MLDTIRSILNDVPEFSLIVIYLRKVELFENLHLRSLNSPLLKFIKHLCARDCVLILRSCDN
jgi:hypothetical protein